MRKRGRALRRRYGRARSAADLWTRQSPDQWGATVNYADGRRYDWGIKQLGEHFVVEVRTPHGIFRVNRNFYDLSKAQKYPARYIERADGADLLEAVLGKHFRPVHWKGAA